jgi:hypothetical protein
VHPSRLAFYDEEMDFVVERGEFAFATGGFCRRPTDEGSV